MTRATTTRQVGGAAQDAAPSSAAPAAANGTEQDAAAREELVRRLAYQLFLDRGGEDGHDVDDWLAAEARLLERSAAPDVAGAALAS